jgi:GPH family glycoside/pentoside/hexuronide:cation symporter
MMQMQKFGLAIALFLLSQGLNWGGLIPATGDTLVPVQPASVLSVIRLEIGLLPALAMMLSLILAWRYPITRDRHKTILLQLTEQQTRQRDN